VTSSRSGRLLRAPFTQRIRRLFTVTLLMAGTCLAQPLVHLSKVYGPPTVRLFVSGRGFSANQSLTIYFDEMLLAETTTDDTGNFSDVAIRVPADALPGDHQVRVVEPDGTEWQVTFDVHTSWSRFGFGNNGHRHNPVENILNRSNVGSVTQYFSFSTFHSLAFTPPAVSHGMVYVGSTDHYVYALDALTGHRIWRFATRSEVVASGAAVYHGTVYIGSEDAFIYALDAKDGHLKWKYKTEFVGGIWSSPTVANDVVYVGGGDYAMYALDARRGTLIWRFPASGLISCAPAVVNGVVYFTSYDSFLYAVNAADGTLLWKFTTGYAPLFVSPAVVDGALYISLPSLYALDANTGGVIWHNSAVTGSLAVADGVLYVADSPATYAVDGKTGQLMWTSPIGALSSAPVIASGIVYVASDNMYALDSSTGAVLWKSDTQADDAFSSPAVANGVIYFSGRNTFYAYGLPYGSSAAAPDPLP
jgi:eukaryotic-like serine/threonine-protein kinase